MLLHSAIWLTVSFLASAQTAATAPPLARGRLSVVSTHPPALGISGPQQSVSVLFDRPIDPLALDDTTFRVDGDVSGLVPGSLALAMRGRRVVYQPARAFQAGEGVTVRLSSALTATDGTQLRPGGHAFEFRIAVAPSTGSFSLASTLQIDPAAGHRRMESFAPGDLNSDGHVDLCAVVESFSSAALHSFLNQANGTGSLDGPSVTALFGEDEDSTVVGDWDADGVLDVLAGASGIHVLRGTQDGHFVAQQLISYVGGFAVLDVDGDADLDLVTGWLQDTVRPLHNDGTGFFVEGVELASGVVGVDRLAAGDMDRDGLEDLVVTGSTGEHLRTLLADGEGSFRFAGLVPQLTGGRVLDLGLGDIDGDGDLDACVACTPYDLAGVLRNLGQGVFASVAVLDAGGDPQTSSLGDVDGDGDLDWLLSNSQSSMGQPTLRLYVNNGSGSFPTFSETTGTLSALRSCLLDADRDGDLDLALADSLAEQILVYHND